MSKTPGIAIKAQPKIENPIAIRVGPIDRDDEQIAKGARAITANKQLAKHYEVEKVRLAEALKQMAEAHGIESHSSGYDDIGYECAVMKHYKKTNEVRQDLCDCGLRAYREDNKC